MAIIFYYYGHFWDSFANASCEDECGGLIEGLKLVGFRQWCKISFIMTEVSSLDVNLEVTLFIFMTEVITFWKKGPMYIYYWQWWL